MKWDGYSETDRRRRWRQAGTDKAMLRRELEKGETEPSPLALLLQGQTIYPLQDCLAVMYRVLLSCACLSPGWALNRCFAWTFGTAAVLAQGEGGGIWLLFVEAMPKRGPLSYYLFVLYHKSSVIRRLSFGRPVMGLSDGGH